MSEYPDDIPWREIIKEAVPIILIVVLFFAVLALVGCACDRCGRAAYLEGRYGLDSATAWKMSEAGR